MSNTLLNDADLPLPRPAAEFHSGPLPLKQVTGRWFHIYRNDVRGSAPDFFGKSAANRFDAPDKTFGVLYAAASIHGAFIEVFKREPSPQRTRRQIDELVLAIRSLAIFSSETLRLVDLAGEGLSKLGLTASIISTRKYHVPQAWAAAFHGHPDRPAGILYRSRHDLDQLCVAVFERAAGQPHLESDVRLDDKKGQVVLASALDRYDVDVADKTP